MSMISTETGLGRSSLYHYFAKGKEEMAHEVLDLVERYFTQELFPILTQPGPWLTNLATFTENLKHYYEGGSLGCILAAFSLNGNPPTVTQRVGELFDLWIKALAVAYEEGGLSQCNAQKRAASAISQLQGGLLLSTACRDASYLEDALRKMQSI